MNFDALVQALRSPLPGVEAQLQLAHPARTLDVPSGVLAREAAVLILLFEQQGQWHFPLIQRTDHNPHDRHRGQISFPGGKRDPEDFTLIDTALREAEEEIGVRRNHVHVLGQLSTLYIPVSNFAVVPTVAYVDYSPTWKPQPGEVDHVIEVPLARLQAADVVQRTQIELDTRVSLRDVPYFDLAGRIVWGATAMILSEFRQVIAKV